MSRRAALALAVGLSVGASLLLSVARASPAPDVATRPAKAADDRGNRDALRALQDLARASSWLLSTLPERRITGLVSVLVHRWRRAVEQALPPPGVGLLETALWQQAARVFRDFVPGTRAATAKVMERFGRKARFFGLYTGLSRMLEEVLTYVEGVARGSERYQSDKVTTSVERWRQPLATSVDRFRRAVEPLGLDLVRAAFYEVILYIGADPEPRARR